MVSITNENLAVVMPVYNEGEIVETTVNEWLKELRRLQIIFKLHVYNDGSTDNTIAKLENLALQNSDLVVHDKKNSGHGPTILQGYGDNSNADWIFQIDSDREMGPESFNELWSRREGYDFLLGSRDGRNQSFVRKVVSSFSRKVVHIFYGKDVFDVNAPYRLMRSSLFKPHYDSMPSHTFAPNVIISGIASLKNVRIFEYPVPHTERRVGQATISSSHWKLFKVAFKSFCQTVRFRWQIS